VSFHSCGMCSIYFGKEITILCVRCCLLELKLVRSTGTAWTNGLVSRCKESDNNENDEMQNFNYLQNFLIQWNLFKSTVNIQVDVFHLQGEDGGSMDLWNTGILPQHYKASQPRRPQLICSLLWKPQILQLWIVYTSLLHPQHHRWSSWSILVARIKTVTSIFLLDVPGILYLSFHTDRAAMGCSLYAFFHNILAIWV
jgi:hypothetical protein